MVSGLVPDGTKPLPEPMLFTDYRLPTNVDLRLLASIHPSAILQKICKICWQKLSFKIKFFEKYLCICTPRGQWVNKVVSTINLGLQIFSCDQMLYEWFSLSVPPSLCPSFRLKRVVVVSWWWWWVLWFYVGQQWWWAVVVLMLPTEDQLDYCYCGGGQL